MILKELKPRKALNWKLSGHKSNLVKDGKTVLDGILKMIEKN